MLKSFFLQKRYVFLLSFFFFLNANANEVERVRNLANSDPFVLENKTASELAQDFILDAGVSEGWNEDKGFFISIGSSVFEEVDPSTNPNFLNIRAMKAFEANITAKGDIISYIRTTMSAEDLITIPSSGLSTEFDEKKYNLELKLQSKIRKYKKAAISYDKTLSNNFNKLLVNLCFFDSGIRLFFTIKSTLLKASETLSVNSSSIFGLLIASL